MHAMHGWQVIISYAGPEVKLHSIKLRDMLTLPMPTTKQEETWAQQHLERLGDKILQTYMRQIFFLKIINMVLW